MTITADDIKLLASERMTDTSDGGGRRTGTVIPDGVAGNIFPKVSRLDGVYGRVNLRKVFGAVRTSNVDTYAGAHAVITDAPDNNKIHASLFSTGSDFDDRTAARDRIESYVIAGPESRMVLYGRQLVGQLAILAYQRVEDALPEVGDVYCLSKETAGVVIYQQYVRITGVSQEKRIMSDNLGDFARTIVTMTIGTPLRYEFAGPDVPSRFVAVDRGTLLRRTSVADAARYFGIQPVSESAAEGALTIKVADVYTPIVPTTQRETPVNNANVAGATSTVPAAAVATPYAGHLITGSAVTTLHLPTLPEPGTLLVRLHVTGVPASPYPVTDDGAGNLVPNALDTSARIAGGTIDYESGLITATLLGAPSPAVYSIEASYIPAARVSQPAHSMSVAVTLETRGTVYVETLHPIPSPGTLSVDFRALGKWYTLRDDGTGAMAGDDASFGTGSVDYATGGVIVTLGALPDVGSTVIHAWGSKIHYVIRAGGTADAGATVDQRFTLTDLPVKPGSVAVHYTSGVTAHTGTDDSAGGISGGNLTGTVNYATGEVLLHFTTKLPNENTTVLVNYNQDVPDDTAHPSSYVGNIAVIDPASFDLSGTPLADDVASGGLAIAMNGDWSGNSIYTVVVEDDGAGVLKTINQVRSSNLGAHANTTQWLIAGGQACGTIDYTTGAISLSSFSATRVAWDTVLQTWAPADAETFTPFGGEYVAWVRTTAASSPSAKTFTADPAADQPLFIDLVRSSAQAVVPGSVAFDLTGKSYIERNGVLYTDIQSDGSGTAAGTVNYATGEASVTAWANDTALGLTVRACLTQVGDWTAVKASFRTAGSPLRPSSVYVEAYSTAGDLLTATSDEAGLLSGSFARGQVNHAMGSVFIEWGQLVTAAGHESDPWYDPANVVAGQIWEPMEVQPSTIRYNAVVLSNLPLNADILGLDPVRLPSDGRVPIYRPADVVLIHNTKSFALPNPAVAGDTYDVGRTDLSEMWLVDAAGARVSSTQYLVDLAAGTVTMAADMDLGATPQPLVARHRIEELNLLSDVQINGELSLTGLLQRDYDTDTFVSSALLFGDMFARVADVFDQVTFTGVWSDARIGSNATAEYDTIDFPIQVTNNGAVTERWRINFTSTTAFQVIGENLGVIATGTTAANLSPVNLLTGLPYFTLLAAGWGAGWSIGNQLRFNTVGASAPIWIARTVLPGATLSGDSLDLQLRGDVDA